MTSLSYGDKARGKSVKKNNYIYLLKYSNAEISSLESKEAERIPFFTSGDLVVIFAQISVILLTLNNSVAAQYFKLINPGSIS